MPIKPLGEIRYSAAKLWGRTCWNLRSAWIFVLTPIILLPLPIAIPNQEAKCGYVILLMLVYYVTEVIPIAVVSLTPLVLLPLLEIVKPRDLSNMYMQEINVSYLGSMMVAISLQRWGVPKRLALWALVQVGTDIRRLLFAIMATTALLSMFINNAPTAIMMVPIAVSTATEYFKQFSMTEPVDEMETHENGEVVRNMQLMGDGPDTNDETHFAVDFGTEELAEDISEHNKNVIKIFILSIPWCCNIGGAGSLYGTPINVLLKANLESQFDDPINITFLNWFAFSLPCSLILLVIGWAYLIIYHLGWRSLFACRRKTPENLKREDRLKRVFQNQYKSLGPMSFAEYAAVGHMTILSLAWITMDPGFVPGWSSLLSKGFASAYSPAILLTVSTFIFPSKFPSFLRFWDKEKIIAPHTPAAPLMDWKTVNQLLPWGTLLLIGGGMAIARGMKVSGLSLWIAGSMDLLTDLPPFAIVILVATFATFGTEIMGGGALLAMVHPILAILAVRVHVHPLYFMFPASVCVVYSFMMPTASPTNAIAYSTGVLTISDMAKPGILMNVLTILVTMLAVNTWGSALFQLDTFPPWAGGNSTV